MNTYNKFITKKSQLKFGNGFVSKIKHNFLYDFQKHLVKWSTEKGRSAIFADCGLGKTPMQLAWAQNIIEHTNKSVLVVAPLAVSSQTVTEGEKFKINVVRSNAKCTNKMIVTNYEQLHKFNPNDYVGVVLDESSVIKHCSGQRRKLVTRFMNKVPYRLLCSATPSPNDYTELGTASEALGNLGHLDMLTMFFKSQDGAMYSTWGTTQKWDFKGHAEKHFWRWMCTWAKALRKPSDLGYADDKFILPKLITNVHIVDSAFVRDGYLLPCISTMLKEEREELNGTVNERCEQSADIVNKRSKPSICWCSLDIEGNLLEKLIPDAVQVSGRDSNEIKEKKLLDFSNGNTRVLVTKPRIGGFGLNWQHCAHMTFFPSHSYEQYYQAIRRCWRFGQTSDVTVDIIATPGEQKILDNVERKDRKTSRMYSALVREMNNENYLNDSVTFNKKEAIPSWL